MTPEQLLEVAGSAGLVMALVQIVKPWVKDSRWYPVLAIAVGMGLNVLAAWATATSTGGPGLHRLLVVTSLVQGVIAGVTSCGLYSVGSAMKKNGSNNPSGGS